MLLTDQTCGGDSPCWSHIFHDEMGEPNAASGDSDCDASVASDFDADEIVTVDLAAIARSATGRGPAWTRRSENLDINLLVFRVGEGVAEHVNAEVDVLLVGIAGEGVIIVDGQPNHLAAGQTILVRKGTRRGTQALADRFSYLSCHRRRAGLQLTRGAGS